MNQLIICFKTNISEKVALMLSDVADIITLDSTFDAIESFIDSTDFLKYDSILGLGKYTGKDKDMIRIEKYCSSQIRNNKENYEKISIPYFLHSNQKMKLTDGIGNSYCNLLSYRLVKKIPNIKYTFLHIPKDFSVEFAIKLIREQL